MHIGLPPILSTTSLLASIFRFLTCLLNLNNILAIYVKKLVKKLQRLSISPEALF